MLSSKYQGRIDPLELLKGAVAGGKKAKLKDKHLIFDKDIKMSLNTPTAWVSQHTKKQYSLGALWLLLECHNAPAGEYMKKVSEYEVETVNVADRNEIIKYFEGKISDSDCINQELKLQLASKNHKRQQPVNGFEQRHDGDKKVKADSTLPLELQVIDFLLRFERPINSKTRSLRCSTKSFDGLLKLLLQTNVDNSKQETTSKIRLSQFSQKKRPIIIVPDSPQSGNLTLNNIQKFLLHGEYCQSPPINLENQHQRKIELQYTIRDKMIIFDVTNNPSLLSLSDWQYVVAAFVQGRKNEFSTWPVRDPLEVFKKVKGFLLRFANTRSQATDWNIKTLILDRHARYRDSDIQKTIWADIESCLYQKL